MNYFWIALSIWNFIVFIIYGADNFIHVGADVVSEKEVDEDAIKAYLADKLHAAWIPGRIVG